MSFDFAVLEFLQGIRTAAIGDAAVLVSALCNKIVIVALFCLIFWCGNKKYAYGLAMSFVFSALAAQGLKILFAVERPFVRWNKIHPYKKALKTATGYSFPSGHTQVASSLLVYTAFSVKHAWAKVLCFATVFAVMLSRLVLGVHTPSDVLVSFIMTSLICAAVNKFSFCLEKKHSLKTAVFGVCLSAAVLVFAYFCGAPFVMAEDCIETAVTSLALFVLYYIEINFIEFDSSKNFIKSKRFANPLKFVLGMLGVLVLYVSVGMIEEALPDFAFAVKNIKNIVVFVWACCVYPIIIKRWAKC